MTTKQLLITHCASLFALLLLACAIPLSERVAHEAVAQLSAAQQAVMMPRIHPH